MEIDKSIEDTDTVRFIKAQKSMAGPYTKNGTNKTNFLKREVQ
jgi:hypothetical protein